MVAVVVEVDMLQDQSQLMWAKMVDLVADTDLIIQYMELLHKLHLQAAALGMEILVDKLFSPVVMALVEVVQVDKELVMAETHLVVSDRYRSWPDSTKRAALDDALGDLQGAARNIFLGQHPELRGLAMRERVQSMREGRPRETVKQRPDGVGGFLGLGGN